MRLVPSCKAANQHVSVPSLPCVTQSALNEGGKLLWIAPSGGRDRRIDPETGAWLCCCCRPCFHLVTLLTCRLQVLPAMRRGCQGHTLHPPEMRVACSRRCGGGSGCCSSLLLPTRPPCQAQVFNRHCQAPVFNRDVSASTADDFMPDKFDPSAVELMRALVTKAKQAGHIYPFTMYSYK